MSRKKQSKPEYIIAGAVELENPISYAVPGEVAIALNTGRSQFINGLVSKVRKGHVLDAAQVIGMLELIRDWTDARYADDRRNKIAQESLSASMTHLQEFRAQLGELSGRIGASVTEAHRLALRHGSGPLGPEDDPE